MFLIGEFSRLTQVSVRMLRYYDEHNLLKPEYTDSSSGYRYYSTKQIPDLHKIVMLRDFGYPVAQIKSLLAHWEPDYLRQQLAVKKQEIEDQLKADQQRLARLEDTLAHLNEEEIQLRYNISVNPVPAYTVLSLRRIIPDYYHEGLLWKELTGYAQKYKIPVHYLTPSFARYFDEEYKTKDVDVEVCVTLTQPIDAPAPLSCYTLEAAEYMASTMVYGPFENINNAYLSFAEFLAGHEQYKMLVPTRQICHKGPWNEPDPEQYLTEIQIPLALV